MTTHIVDIEVARSRLSELISEAEEGTEVIVARNGKPAARISAWVTAPSVRRPGAWAGRIEYNKTELEAQVDNAAGRIAGLGLDWPGNWVETSRHEAGER